MDKGTDKASVTIGGRDYVIVPRDEYNRLTGLAKVAALPPFPAPDADGNYPAKEYMAASLSRKIVKGRVEAGLTQRALAEQAGITFEHLNRLESGRITPTLATMMKIEGALKRASAANARRTKRRRRNTL